MTGSYHKYYERDVTPLSNNKKPLRKTVQIELSDLKLQALEMSLNGKRKDFSDEMNAYAQRLYEKNVPKDTQTFLASVEGTGPTPTTNQTQEN